MFERDADGRLKRIEYRGKYLRASRTGGLALRARTKAAGVNLTANTAHGVRVSTGIAKGTQAAFQNGRFILRGRYGEGPTKLNLSKSGVSVSTKTETGTINWFKPGYSSVKIGGVQMRGKKAVYIQLVVGLIQAVFYLALFLAQAAVLLLQALYWLAVRLWNEGRQLFERGKAKRLEPLEDTWMRALEERPLEEIEAAMDLAFLELAAGRALERGAATSSAEAGALVLRLLEGASLKPPRDLELLFGCLARTYAARAGDADTLEKFFALDEQAREAGSRTRLQDRLLGVYAESCGIEQGA